jgi:hypothetical protein
MITALALCSDQVGRLCGFCQPLAKATALWVWWFLIYPLFVEKFLAGQFDIPVRVFGRVITVHFCQYASRFVFIPGCHPVAIADLEAKQERAWRLAADEFELWSSVFFRHDFVLAAIAADFEGGGVFLSAFQTKEYCLRPNERTCTKMDLDSTVLAIKRAEQVLDTAYFGLKVLKTGAPSERSAGLRNVLVFGRSVTFVIQNLKSIVGEDRFNRWYAPIQDQMRADPLMRYFVEARNNLEKQGRLDVGVSGTIHGLSDSDFAKLEKPPFESTSFFMGDQNGGSGWEMDLGGGESIKYYITIPKSVGEFRQVFLSLPENIPSEIRDLSVDELCSIYLDKLAALLMSTRKEFLLSPKERPYLRLVK